LERDGRRNQDELPLLAERKDGILSRFLEGGLWEESSEAISIIKEQHPVKN
jgi:hypothetical protein